MPDVGKRLVELAAGVYVEQDTLNIVQHIQEYDPNLVVKYLDPDRGGGLDDPPYKIYERCPDGFERLVFGVWQLDERILQRLFAADTQKFDIVGNIDAHNAKVKAEKRRRYREEVLAEANDVAKHVLKSPKQQYTVAVPDDPSMRLIFDSTHKIKRRTKSGLEPKPSDLMD